MARTKALTVAKYFLSLTSEDEGDLISNLKLQKLLYYAQGCWVALNGEEDPLFGDALYAWKHGPVVKSVYHHFNEFGAQALPAMAAPKLEGEIVEFLDEIYRVFGKFSAWKLREMTHKESPWLDYYEPDVMDIQIPLKALAKYFKKHVKRQKA